METATVLKNFSFTSITWHEVGEKVDYSIIRSLLNKKLDLSKYGESIHQIQFTYIADYDEDAYQEEMKYDAETKILFLSLRLDYEKVKHGTNEEVLILMQDLFLTSIFYYYAVGVRDFDFREFYDDLKKAF